MSLHACHAVQLVVITEHTGHALRLAAKFLDQQRIGEDVELAEYDQNGISSSAPTDCHCDTLKAASEVLVAFATAAIAL